MYHIIFNDETTHSCLLVVIRAPDNGSVNAIDLLSLCQIQSIKQVLAYFMLLFTCLHASYKRYNRGDVIGAELASS